MLADLVWRPGPLRGQPGRLLSGAGAQEDRRHPPGGDGHVEGVSQLDRASRPAGRRVVRQVPRAAASRRGARHGAQERVRPAVGEGPTTLPETAILCSDEDRWQAARGRNGSPFHGVPAPRYPLVAPSRVERRSRVATHSRTISYGYRMAGRLRPAPRAMYRGPVPCMRDFWMVSGRTRGSFASSALVSTAIASDCIAIR